MNKNRIVFDTETTGLNVYMDEILDIAIIDGDGDILLNARYKPTKNDEWPEAEAINGISPADVAGCPSIEADADEIRAIFRKADEIVGYNVDFDLAMLAGAGIDLPEGVETVDTMKLYAAANGEWSDDRKAFRWKKLTDAADAIGHIWTGDAHGALADARATLAVQDWIESADGAAALASVAERFAAYSARLVDHFCAENSKLTSVIDELEETIEDLKKAKA